MTLLGPTLYSYSLSHTLTSEEIFKYIHQTVQAVEILHNIGYIHRDIKPTNLCLGLQNTEKVYLIDFGIAKKWSNTEREGFHFNENSKFKGNLEFCSDHVALGCSASRRDDIESLIYVGIYLMNKSLPWINKANSISSRFFYKKEFYQALPEEIIIILEYCKSLEFADKPDYEYVCRLLEKFVMKTSQLEKYDFNIQKRYKRMKTKEKEKSQDPNTFKTLVVVLPELSYELKLKNRCNIR